MKGRDGEGQEEGEEVREDDRSRRGHQGKGQRRQRDGGREGHDSVASLL